MFGLTLSGCMAHARRKFDEALSNDQERSEIMLALFGQLYYNERDIQVKTILISPSSISSSFSKN